MGGTLGKQMSEGMKLMEASEEEQLSPTDIKIAKVKAQYNNRATATLNDDTQRLDIIAEINEKEFNEEAERMAFNAKMTQGHEKAGLENLMDTVRYLGINSGIDRFNEEEIDHRKIESESLAA